MFCVFCADRVVLSCSEPFQSWYLAMSLQNMNQTRLRPRKDYTANRLVSGSLQLAQNTSLFLDETRLEPGQLDATGEADGNPCGWGWGLGPARPSGHCLFLQVCVT